MSGTSTVEPVAWLVDPGVGSVMDKVFLQEPMAFQYAQYIGRGGSVTPLYASPPSPAQTVTDEQVEAAAAVIWNDLFGARAGAWDNPPANSVSGIQFRATARAALTAALSQHKGA